MTCWVSAVLGAQLLGLAHFLNAMPAAEFLQFGIIHSQALGRGLNFALLFALVGMLLRPMVTAGAPLSSRRARQFCSHATPLCLAFSVWSVRASASVPLQAEVPAVHHQLHPGRGPEKPRGRVKRIGNGLFARLCGCALSFLGIPIPLGYGPVWHGHAVTWAFLSRPIEASIFEPSPSLLPDDLTDDPSQHDVAAAAPATAATDDGGQVEVHLEPGEWAVHLSEPAPGLPPAITEWPILSRGLRPHVYNTYHPDAVRLPLDSFGAQAALTGRWLGVIIM
ncbi:unnamed protein product, partial [Symbiodinium sp. CCMP2456]